MKEIVIIPARYASSRFPGKPLVEIGGRTMIERVWAIAVAAVGKQSVFVATDHGAIVDAVRAFGGEALLTSESCENGTERIQEALGQLDFQPELVVNLQGDAVLTPPHVVSALLEAMRADSSIGIATPAVRIDHTQYLEYCAAKARGDASGTFVTFDRRGRALYFSKAVIPFLRKPVKDAPVYRHVGMYAYRLSALKQYLELVPGPLEAVEGLEQLRALEHGLAVRVVVVDYGGRTHYAVDKPEDVKRVEEIIAREGELVG